MTELRNKTSLVVTMFAAAAALLASGCSHVKRDELTTQLDEVRSELRSERQAADDELAARIAGVSRRVDEVEGGVEANRARLASLNQELEAFQTRFDATIERMEGMIAFNVPVHFDYDSATLRETDKPLLDRFAAVVREYYPDSLVTVEGFADPAGSEEYNERLGRRRAEGVKGYLTEIAGLAPERVRAVSYGEAPDWQVRPGAHGPGDEGLENRRVTLVIDHRDAATSELTAPAAPDEGSEAEGK